MDQLNGDLLGDSDSDDQDYVPSGGESDNEQEETTKQEEIEEETDTQKRKTDALWADFLADVETPSKKAKVEDKVANVTESKESAEKSIEPQKLETPEVEEPTSRNGGSSTTKTVDEMFNDEPSSSKITIKQVFDFAGEKIEVEKEVEKDSKEAKKLLADQEKQKDSSQKVLVRPKVGGGLSTIVGNVLNKKSKMSILEKSRLDWSGFKKNEGISEELANHNKGKDGYLEKMAFLDRTDLRQFEIEKSMRDKQRSRGNM